MPVSKKHIVLLTSEFPPLPGGIGNHAYNLAEYLSEEGYKVKVIADQRDNEVVEAEFDSNLKSTVKRIKKTTPRFLMYLKRIWLCYKFSKSADFLICSGKFPLWVGAFLKPLHSSESVAIIHGTEVNFSNSRLRKSIDWSLKRFDKVIAVSNFTMALVADLNLKNISVIPNGFSVKPNHSEIENSSNLKGFPKLLTVGNVTERKGQVNVIKHLPLLKITFPDVHYHCVGFKTEAEKLKKLAKKLNVLEHITFHGHVSHETLKSFYSNADVCVMLSQTTSTGDVEGFGIALIEANYFGLPTIGAKGCGIEDAILHEKSGLLVKGDNSDDFFNAVKSILDNKKDYTENAKLWAKEHQWENIIKRYVDCIEA